MKKKFPMSKKYAYFPRFWEACRKFSATDHHHHPNLDMARLSACTVPTMREPSVLSVCGCGLAPCTAHPRVGSALDSFTRVLCSAVSGRAAH